MKSPAIARRMMDALERHYPDANTELHYRTPFELLVATILSAQSTDERVNLVTPALFAAYPDARALAGVDPERLEPLIRSTGFFRQKSKALVGMARALVERHGGEVPADIDALTNLPGVGRKTANVVLGHALGVPGLPVDRHVLRVANRLGLVQSDDPGRVEQILCALVPPARWTKTSDLLILHGRRICRPTPLCPRCHVRSDCDFFRTGMAVRSGRAQRQARPEGARQGTGARPAPAAKTPARGRTAGRTTASRSSGKRR